LTHSNLFCELLSANLETMDLNQLKQEINNGKMIVEKQSSPLEKAINNLSPKNLEVDMNQPPSPTSSANDSMEYNESEEIQINITKCYARTAGNKQCSRKKQKGQDFCGSHLHNQPHGRIDQTLDPSKNKP